MEQKKQTRKSVPRPRSGRRGVDGAIGLVQVGIRLTKGQHEWLRQNGNASLRALIQSEMDTPPRPKIDFAALTPEQKEYWAKECEKHGVPIPDFLK